MRSSLQEPKVTEFHGPEACPNLDIRNVQYSIRRIGREEKENPSILNAGMPSIRTVFEGRRHLMALRTSE
jgi:hypothetical protein